MLLSKIEELLIFESGCHSDAWNNGLIYSIYKSREKCNPNNYRGINYLFYVSFQLNILFVQHHANNLKKN